ncbi:MAG: hypothetical protein JWN89_459 [Parcubacteria group bacterium]|nr:hypothetical protein [Parcubacteria group bacterium]
MPNIVLVGFDMLVIDELRREINRLAKKLELDQDSVVTVLSIQTRSCADGTPAPYAIVRCNDQESLDQMARAINLTLGLGVEKELIQSYLEPNPGSKWNQEAR